MLTITVPANEFWDEAKQEFVYVDKTILSLEHSLISLSKWESRWEKPFLSKDKKTHEETVDYIRCMTLTKNVDPVVYDGLTSENYKLIDDYISSPKTATWFRENSVAKRSSEQITSELIYYWMVALGIPFECEKWHLNRLLTLIRICNIKNQPAKKHSKRDIMNQNAALNAARRAQTHSRG